MQYIRDLSINGTTHGYNTGGWQKTYTFPLTNSQYVHSILCSCKSQYNTQFLNVSNFSSTTCVITATNILSDADRLIYDVFVFIVGD